MKKQRRFKAARLWLVILFAAYYLMCGFGVYTEFIAKLPEPAELNQYTGIVRSIKIVSGRFGGDNIRIEFEDGRRILMNGSFSHIEKLMIGDEATVLYQETPLARYWQGYVLQQDGEEIHGFEMSFRQMQRERRINSILLVLLILLPPVGLGTGLVYERRLLEKDKKRGA